MSGMGTMTVRRFEDGSLQVLEAGELIEIAPEVMGVTTRYSWVHADVFTVQAKNGTWRYRLGPPNERGNRVGVLIEGEVLS